MSEKNGRLQLQDKSFASTVVLVHAEVIGFVLVTADAALPVLSAAVLYQ
ncbi:MAG: hypothetical protein ACRD5J_07580 [Nitrososphaeraceae archaeon]